MIRLKDEIKTYFDNIIKYKRELEIGLASPATPAKLKKQYERELQICPNEFYIYLKSMTFINSEIYADGVYIIPTCLKNFKKICDKYDHAGFNFYNVLYITKKDFERGFYIWLD